MIIHDQDPLSQQALVLTRALASPFALFLPLTSPGLGLLLFASGGFVLGVGVSVGNVVVGTFRQSYCPPHLLGRVSSASMATNQGTIAIGSALGGVLGSAIGIRPTMWLLTAPLALTWLLLAFSPAGKGRELPLAVRPERHNGQSAGTKSLPGTAEGQP
ncbi:hypothetical protein ACFYZ5_39870 [Streptomyces chartreusis]|uniref:hypothetical protein n=1 Tax=Streptomyces chartreusis TaxID=1969 RepID=UPI00369EB9DF